MPGSSSIALRGPCNSLPVGRDHAVGGIGGGGGGGGGGAAAGGLGDSSHYEEIALIGNGQFLIIQMN